MTMRARILVIEDNPANLELMRYLLQSFGHTVLTAPDGECGVTIVRKERPDLVLCDVQLPGLDGMGVARVLKGDPQLCAVPLIAITAFAMVGDRDRMLQAGFDGYLPKPITPETFLRDIEGFLRPDLRSAALTPMAARKPSSAV
jgi:CheY-like chemotaxis protein